MAPWKLPLIVAAIVVPIAAGFLTAGPALGVAVGALAALVLLLVAARARPRGPIGDAGADRRRVLIAATSPAEAPGDVARIAAAAGLEGDGSAEVMLLVPARIGFLDRWASDVEGARRRAQERLVAMVAELAKVGIAAEARVGDEDVVQAVEDQLRSFPAGEVVLVSAAGDEVDAAAAELRSRLRAEFHEVRVGGGQEG